MSLPEGVLLEAAVLWAADTGAVPARLLVLDGHARGRDDPFNVVLYGFGDAEADGEPTVQGLAEGCSALQRGRAPRRSCCPRCQAAMC
jgi:hypothetical protein